MSERTKADRYYDDDAPKDRSYLAAAAWAVGLLITGIAFYQLGGSNIQTSAADRASSARGASPLVDGSSFGAPNAYSQTAVPRAGATGVAAPDMAASDEAAPDMAAPRTRPTARNLSKDISFERDPQGSIAKPGALVWSAFIRNNAAQKLISWTARVSLSDKSGKLVDEQLISSKDPIPVGGKRSFSFKSTNVKSGSVHVTIQPLSAEFENGQ